MSRIRGILLFSGGLDSILAAALLQDQEIELEAFHCILPFVNPDDNEYRYAMDQLARQVHLSVHYQRCGREYMEMIRKPAHGYGKYMNPCVDCKLHFIAKAAEYMKESGADFVVSGEVVGQRPMSQLKHTLRHIEKESGIEGRLLRPLSAHILPPTRMEEEGLIDRSKLLNISGRGRKTQMELAEKYGIREFHSPAGGCLFTDRFISKRVKDLLEHQDDFHTTEIFLLTVGRHFRITESCKMIISRREEETDILSNYGHLSDAFIVPTATGPVGWLRGTGCEKSLDIALRLFSRYMKRYAEPVQAEVTYPATGERVLATIPAYDEGFSTDDFLI